MEREPHETNSEYDPVAWVNRLREVNKGSLFSGAARELIEFTLSALEKELNVQTR